jgi:predicted AlkP superfamily phosphohydrolase/phosphomutase
MKSAWDMTRKRFQVIEHLMMAKEWEFFMFVEIGLDRIHHAFWKYFDTTHHLYDPDKRYANVIRDYYRLLDDHIGRLLSILDENTVVFVVSDHGVKAMKGAFCINEWFIKKGYLVLNSYPDKPQPFEKLDVNWEKTTAWGWGGYYGRIFINRRGREIQGIVDDADFENVRTRIKRELESEKDRNGRVWDTKVHRPEELYPVLKGDVPDLMAYFDDLAYRSAGTVGHREVFLSGNDTGPDDAMHDWEGVYIKHDPAQKNREVLDSFSILDVMPEVMRVFGLERA